jgi:hypothetical protein
VVEGQGWPAHVAAGWGGRPTRKRVRGWRAHVEDGVGWWAHEKILNLNINMSLNSDKI